MLSFFILLSICANSHISPLSILAASRCCCHSPLLKYCVQYGRSRHHLHFRYLASDTLGGTLLCRLLLRNRCSWSHWSRCCRSAKWGAINVFPPNMPVIVLPYLYRHHTHHYASLLPSSYATLTTIHFFFFAPIILSLCCISAHIRRVSAHRFPPRICLPYATVSFVPVVYSLMIARTFRFHGVGTSLNVSSIPFLLISLCDNSLFLLSVATASGFLLR